MNFSFDYKELLKFQQCTLTSLKSANFFKLSLLFFILISGLGCVGCSSNSSSSSTQCSDLIQQDLSLYEEVESLCDRLDNDCDGLIDEGLYCDPNPNQQGGEEGGLNTEVNGGEENSGGMSLGGMGSDVSSGGMSMGGSNPQQELDCLNSCGLFAECALAECGALDDDDLGMLIGDCVTWCTPELAEVFNSRESCLKKLDFVSDSRPEFEGQCVGTPMGGMENGGSMGGQQEGGDQGGNEGGMMNEEVSCVQSCIGFADCAIDLCVGYQQDDHDLLVEGCLEQCSPILAVAFNNLNSCEDKINFALRVQRDFESFCSSTTDGFCETHQAVCGPWPNEDQECQSLYTNAPRGADNQINGQTRTCFEFHLGQAQRAERLGNTNDIQPACQSAAGGDPCRD